MIHQAATRLIVVAGLLSVASYPDPVRASTPSVSRPVAPPAISSEQQWATFDFTGSNDSGSLQLGQPLELSMTLSGMPPDPMPFVAICESAHFEPQIVPLKQDPVSSVMRATTTLMPVSQERPSLGPQLARLHVTFARSTDKKFERVMTRIVYFTMSDTKPNDGQQASLITDQNPPKNPPGKIDLAAGRAEPVPGAIPLISEELVEEDLLPSRSAQPAPTYWDLVRDLLNRGWNRATGHLPASFSPQTVQVQFRLYPGGHAQLLQIADGSGASEIDQAGILAVADAQPFPPFPQGVGNKPIEIHVRLQTGAKSGVRDFHTRAPQQDGRASSASKN